MTTPTANIGTLLRDWRIRRRLSQLDLALEAEVSARHVSFLETGRAMPSRDMLVRLADRLEVPLRERNVMLTAAGYAPLYSERMLDDPDMLVARTAVDRVLAGHEPYPALAVDRTWTMVAANRSVGLLTSGIRPELLEPPVNVLRLALHPDGLAPRVANFDQWREHLLARLARQAEQTGDSVVSSLHEELRGYARPASLGPSREAESDASGVLVPLQLRTDIGMLTFISTITVFGSPLDVTLSELAVEAFFPADSFTVSALQQLAADQG